MITEKDTISAIKGLLDTYNPPTTESENWKHFYCAVFIENSLYATLKDQPEIEAAE